MAMLVRAVTVAAVAVLTIASQAAAEFCVEVDVHAVSPAPSTALLESMKSEVDAIWKPYGVRIQWTNDDGAVRCPSIAWSFDVQMSDASGPRPRARLATLGRTSVRPSATRRSPIHVDYAATRRLIGLLRTDQLDQALGRRETTPADLGRALGRVLAHEIGHGLLGAPHERRGLMRATFASSELVSHRRRGFTLSGAEIARLGDRARATPATVLSACDD